MAVVEGKTKVIVVDNIAAYQKGRKIKKEIDYISKVLGGEK